MDTDKNITMPPININPITTKIQLGEDTYTIGKKTSAIFVLKVFLTWLHTMLFYSGSSKQQLKTIKNY